MVDRIVCFGVRCHGFRPRIFFEGGVKQYKPAINYQNRPTNLVIILIDGVTRKTIFGIQTCVPVIYRVWVWEDVKPAVYIVNWRVFRFLYLTQFRQCSHIQIETTRGRRLDNQNGLWQNIYKIKHKLDEDVIGEEITR